jgi:hypothetical protein
VPYGNDYNGNNTYSETWLDCGTNPKAHTTSPYIDTITDLAAGTYEL